MWTQMWTQKHLIEQEINKITEILDKFALFCHKTPKNKKPYFSHIGWFRVSLIGAFVSTFVSTINCNPIYFRHIVSTFTCVHICVHISAKKLTLKGVKSRVP